MAQPRPPRDREIDAEPVALRRHASAFDAARGIPQEALGTHLGSAAEAHGDAGPLLAHAVIDVAGPVEDDAAEPVMFADPDANGRLGRRFRPRRADTRPQQVQDHGALVDEMTQAVVALEIEAHHLAVAGKTRRGNIVGKELLHLAELGLERPAEAHDELLVFDHGPIVHRRGPVEHETHVVRMRPSPQTYLLRAPTRRGRPQQDHRGRQQEHARRKTEIRAPHPPSPSARTMMSTRWARRRRWARGKAGFRRANSALARPRARRAGV